MEVHIGKEIEKIYESSGMKLSEFAKRINTSTRNVYSIFERPEIKTDQLFKISKVLNHDFFALYKSETYQAEEPRGEYGKPKGKVVIMVELDGLQTTLDQVVKKLRAINQTI
ncbi:MAG TPA: hypothetical protein VL728_15725 [Cyclobacteriaceae bacterium]|jgi:hypothetical protein|nr:hypothetical protein [Cyclobacteriaceae bacterium]